MLITKNDIQGQELNMCSWWWNNPL